MTAQAQTDSEALQAVLAYYDTHHDQLAALFPESNETRLRALFVMYTLHVSHVYDVVTEPAETFLNYLRVQHASHCGWYSQWGQVLNEALGLEARLMGFQDGSHGWNEVNVDGQWETFDATVNVWLSEPVETLVKGGPRKYRTFYTPLLDADYPKARYSLYESRGHWDVLNLRRSMIGLGIYYQVNAAVRSQAVRVQRP